MGSVAALKVVSAQWSVTILLCCLMGRCKFSPKKSPQIGGLIKLIYQLMLAAISRAIFIVEGASRAVNCNACRGAGYQVFKSIVICRAAKIL